MPPELNDLMVKAATYLNIAMVTFVGALAKVLHETFIDEKPFGIGRAVTIIFISFFVGLVMGSLLPPEMPARDGVLLMTGYCGLEVLDALRAWYMKRFKETVAVDDKP